MNTALTRPILLCLHGWGGSKESFTELRAALKGVDIDILTPDLPGFGDESDPPRAWSTDDYADWVIDWLEAKLPPHPNPLPVGEGKRHFFILGHSHGGRIAIKLASRLPHLQSPISNLQHLFLCASAGIRRPRHWKRIFGLILAKTGKSLLWIHGLRFLEPYARTLLYKLVRVHDYERASSVMQQTLQKVSAEDLTPLLSKITVPTDIFWGTQDSMTPVSDGRLMHTLISGSRLHLFPGTRHRVHRERAREISEVIAARLSALPPSRIEQYSRNYFSRD